jgi:hypothetical protein
MRKYRFLKVLLRNRMGSLNSIVSYFLKLIGNFKNEKSITIAPPYPAATKSDKMILQIVVSDQENWIPNVFIGSNCGTMLE